MINIFRYFGNLGLTGLLITGGLLSSPALAAPNCYIVQAGHPNLLVLIGFPKKSEAIAPYKHSEPSTLEEAREVVLGLIRSGKCELKKEELPLCVLRFESFGEGGGGEYVIRQVSSDRSDQRFRIPVKRTTTSKVDDIEASLKDLSGTDVPVCRVETERPKCALRPGTSSFHAVDIVGLYSNGTIERIEDGNYDDDTSDDAMKFIKALRDRKIFCD